MWSVRLTHTQYKTSLYYLAADTDSTFSARMYGSLFRPVHLCDPCTPDRSRAEFTVVSIYDLIVPGAL